jgi:hypothetical protein
VLNKYSSDVIESIDLRKRGIENLITSNIREIDDKIAILHKEFNGVSGIFITYVDIDSQTTVTHKLMEFLQDSNNYQIKFSNFDSDLIFLSNASEYQIRSIANSKYPLGRIDENLMKYLPGFKWGNTERLFGNPKIKWNTNNDPANNLNIISNDNVFIGDSSYHVIVANSRFYVIKQKIEDFYKYRITKNLQQQHLPPICSKSSFGNYLNDNIFSILNDVIALHNQAHSKYVFLKDDTKLKTISNIEIELENLYLHTNEKVHATNFQRIFRGLFSIQKKLISISQTNE